jgi:nicotinate-nucleotide adenylyltransferase
MARRIGILGGSFNPAHRGHLDLSLAAIHRLGLDQVWWLVSPQNPLKTTDGMAPFAERLAAARAFAKSAAGDSRIKVTDLESRLGTTYTAETLELIRRRFPHHHFVWLMGADNLAQISEWKDWQQIFHALPIAVFARPTYSLSALAAKAARRFAPYRLREGAGRKLVMAKPPSWLFVHARLNPISATEIRKRRSKLRS